MKRNVNKSNQKIQSQKGFEACAFPKWTSKTINKLSVSV